MSREDLVEAVRQAVRAELRRCGLRPPAPSEPGVWRWDAERDEWVAPPKPAGAPPAPVSA